MVNDKTHLYGPEDANKDRKNTEKRKDQQQFSRFSVASSSALNTAGLEPKAPATQIDTKVQIGDPYDDTKGSVGASTQTVSFDVYGSNYTFYEVTDDVNFVFNELPTGRHITFTLDILVNQVAGVTIGFPTVTNPPVLAGNDGDRYVLEFIAVNRTDPTGVNPPVQTITFISGGTGGGVSFPLTPDISAKGNVTGAVDIDLSAITAHYQEMILIGDITLTFSNPPADNKEISFIIDITQDGVGGRTVGWPPSVRVDPTVGSAVDARTVIIVTTVDNGVNYDALIVTGGEVNAANKQLSNLSSPVLNTDLDFGTFDIFNVDIIQFALGGASLLSTDVGFDANVNGGITTNILTNVGGNWKVTEEGSTRLIYDTANNAFQVQDVNPLISLQETGTSTAFTISKIAGRTDISEPTEIQFQIAVTNIFEVLSTGITMADNKFIANVDQIGFRITGNFVEDDASGLRLITVPTDFVMMGDGTNTFMTVQNTHFDIGGRYWQLNAMASPGVTGSATLGRVFLDSGNSNHLSIIRNAAIIDLEAGGGSNEFDDSLFRIFDNATPSKKIAFQASSISVSTTRTITVPDTNFTLAGLGINQAWTGVNTFNLDILVGSGVNLGSSASKVAAGFFTNIRFNASTQLITANASEMRFGLPTGDVFNWEINLVDQLTLSATALNLHGNDITNTGNILNSTDTVETIGDATHRFGAMYATVYRLPTTTSDSTTRILSDAGGIEYHALNADTHAWFINNTILFSISKSGTIDTVLGFNRAGQSILADVNGIRIDVGSGEGFDVIIGGTGTVFFVDANGIDIITFTDATRPTPAAAGAGHVIFNSDDGGLNVSDGTNWRAPSGGWVNT